MSLLDLQFLVALLVPIKERSWKPPGAILVALAFFFTLPRYLICCRCDGYGNKCYPVYLGLITSKYLPGVEGKEVNTLCSGLEGLTLATLGLAPAIGLRGNRKPLILHLTLADFTVGLHFWHACRHCATYATDWRRDCPSANLARAVFSAGQET